MNNDSSSVLIEDNMNRSGVDLAHIKKTETLKDSHFETYVSVEMGSPVKNKSS